ncbi:hypothetical protein B0H14DRAFT_3890174 [Mycena olivaceomarginata]|nr:hypothetical protein B0H14DRAFT_3890174 [Mycena olivaceomarginata]
MSGSTQSLQLSEALVHHRLRHLHLHAQSLRPELLTLPALHSLRVSAADISILGSVDRMLQRSMASLSALHIDEFAASLELSALLAAAPSVEHLTVCAATKLLVSDADRFFAPFVDEGDTPAVLPALRTLRIQGLVFGAALVRMVHSRLDCALSSNYKTISKWEGTRSEALTISDVRSTHISHLLRMKDLEAKAGLKFFDESLSGVRILGESH